MPKNRYEALLYEVCVGMGFCGAIVDGRPMHVEDLVPSDGPVTSDQFVEWLYQAEGADPNEPLIRRHRGALRDAFVRHMGAEIVDARELKSEGQ